jgi:putative ABC transport system permease protein
VSNLLWRSSRRYLTRHPWLAGLSVLGVALGVAVVTAIDLANASASRAFSLSAEGVAGKATHRVRSATPGGLPDTLYRWLRAEQGARPSAPVVQGYAQASSDSGRTLQVLGIDPLAEGPFRPYLASGSGIDLGAFMAESRAALLAASTAQALSVAAGDSLALRVKGRPAAVRVAGLLHPDNERSRRALSNLLVVDLATAQALFDESRLSRIDLIVPSGSAGKRYLRNLRAALPDGAEIVRSEARTATLSQMTEAFNLNLQALSLLALVVGMFLIYNTMTFAVVQRRTLIGRMRALGVRRREVFGLVLGEAAAVGALGTALGLGLGVLLAQGLVRLVTQTINDLYYVVSVRELALNPWTLAKGAALGLGATVLSALGPAREAATAPVGEVLQRSQEESRFRSRVGRLALGGLALGVVCAALLLVPSRSIVVSYLALLALLLGAALVVPLLVVGFARAARPLAERAFGVIGRMAARGLRQTLSRTAVALAALLVAVAATVGVGVMVQSFRSTVSAWLNYSLRADVYVQAPSPVFRRATTALDSSSVARIKQTDGVAGTYSVRNVRVGSEVGRVELAVIEPGPRTPQTFRFKRGEPSAIWDSFEQGKNVIVSEPFAFRHDVAVGDTLRLRTDRGRRAFTVRGVFYDYASDQGTAMMSRSVYDRFYDDPNVSGVALYAAEGLAVNALIERLRRQAGGSGQRLVIRSNRTLRRTSLKIFDRTFTVTAVLRFLVVIVAFIGVLSALMALQLERGREWAVLRASGMTPRQVGAQVTLQTGLTGLFAGLFALPLGLALAWVLIYVINRRSFGWTLQWEVPPGVLLQAVALAVGAALLAGAYPAWRIAKTRVAEGLR